MGGSKRYSSVVGIYYVDLCSLEKSWQLTLDFYFTI